MPTTDVAEQSEITNAERMANIGISVTCKNPKLETVRVKDLSLEKLLELLGDFSLIFEKATSKAGEGRGDLAFLAEMVRSPESLQAIKKIMAVSTGKDAADFDETGVADWLKLFVALKLVTDWEEISQLFFQLIPRESFAAWTANSRAERQIGTPSQS